MTLAAAIAALTQPVTESLLRDPSQTRARRKELDEQHRKHIAYLRMRLALVPPVKPDSEASEQRHDEGVERLHCAMRTAGEAHRRRRAGLVADTAVAPSLIARLEAAVQSSTGAGDGTPSPKHARSPIGLAAAELLHQIRRVVGDRDGDLCAALRTWRPDDELLAAQWAEQWVKDAKAVLEPAKGFEITRPCPACGARWVTAEEDGERVRRSALHVNADARIAVCLAAACGATWGEERWPLLVAALEDADRLDVAAHQS